MPLRLLLATAAAVAILGASAPGRAQTDPMAMMHTATANELGVLEYCQSQGAIGPEAVAAQRKTMAALPPAKVDTAAAEATGKAGTLTGGGNTVTLAALAGQKGTSVADLCKQMSSAVLQSAAMQQSAPTGMPAMPSGMPAMPSGMPAMPSGMPAMPGIPSK